MTVKNQAIFQSWQKIRNIMSRPFFSLLWDFLKEKSSSLLVPKLRVPTQQWLRESGESHRAASAALLLLLLRFARLGCFALVRRASASKMTGSEICEGCCEVIYDRFVMRVGNSPWHEDCLFCSECHTPLSNSCYYKEGRLLCRSDYERRFGVKCGRCGQCLLPHDLVMRTRFSIYHIACFVCTVCSTTLNRGDQYVVRAGQVSIILLRLMNANQSESEAVKSPNFPKHESIE